MTQTEFLQVFHRQFPSLEVSPHNNFGLILKVYRFTDNNKRFTLRVHTKADEIGTNFRFYLGGFDPTAPRGPWLHSYYQRWCNSNPEFRNWCRVKHIDGNAFPGRPLGGSGRGVHEQRNDEGGLLGISCSVTDRTVLGEWLVHLFQFSDSIVDEWNRVENGEKIGSICLQRETPLFAPNLPPKTIPNVP